MRIRALSHQFPISEVPSVENPKQGVTKNMRIVAVVETPFQFLKVSVQVLPAHLVEGTNNGPLEQAPDPLDTVVWTSPTTHSSEEWLTVLCMVS